MSEQRRWVLDASAALHVVMRLPTAEPVIDKLEQANLILVPQLYFSEAANALWKYVSHNQLSAEQAIERYQDVCALPDQAISDQTLALEALSLASTYNHPVYNMIYAVLARRNACGVLSKDSRLAKLLVSTGVTTAP
jgi:predicted nucleic acid-binding protein